MDQMCNHHPYALQIVLAPPPSLLRIIGRGGYMNKYGQTGIVATSSMIFENLSPILTHAQDPLLKTPLLIRPEAMTLHPHLHPLARCSADGDRSLGGVQRHSFTGTNCCDMLIGNMTKILLPYTLKPIVAILLHVLAIWFITRRSNSADK